MPAILHLTSDAVKARAHHWVNVAEHGVVVKFYPPKRTLPQNDKMWAMLADISKAKPRGLEHTPEVWKALLMKACGHAVQFVNGLDGEPFPVGFRSSKLSKEQISELFEFINQFAAENGVEFTQ